jgi:hypothetical protein
MLLEDAANPAQTLEAEVILPEILCDKAPVNEPLNRSKTAGADASTFTASISVGIGWAMISL